MQIKLKNQKELMGDHDSHISSMVVSSDNTLLITAGEKEVVRFYDFQTFTKIFTMNLKKPLKAAYLSKNKINLL